MLHRNSVGLQCKNLLNDFIKVSGWPSGLCLLQIMRIQVRILLEAEFSSWLYGVSLHRVFITLPSFQCNANNVEMDVKHQIIMNDFITLFFIRPFEKPDVLCYGVWRPSVRP